MLDTKHNVMQLDRSHRAYLKIWLLTGSKTLFYVSSTIAIYRGILYYIETYII